MKKLIQTFIFLFALVASPSAMAQFQFHNTTPTSQQLSGITCLSSTQCFAIGATGNILEYDGTTWTLVTTPSASPVMYAITCVNNTLCIAVGGLARFGSTMTRPGQPKLRLLLRL